MNFVFLFWQHWVRHLESSTKDCLSINAHSRSSVNEVSFISYDGHLFLFYKLSVHLMLGTSIKTNIQGARGLCWGVPMPGRSSSIHDKICKDQVCTNLDVNRMALSGHWT